MPNKADKVVDFAWEPKGSRFAMLHGDGPRPSFSIYAMRDMKTSAKGVQLLGIQHSKQANSIHWSPQVYLQLWCTATQSCYPLGKVVHVMWFSQSLIILTIIIGIFNSITIN